MGILFSERVGEPGDHLLLWKNIIRYLVPISLKYLGLIVYGSHEAISPFLLPTVRSSNLTSPNPENLVMELYSPIPIQTSRLPTYLSTSFESPVRSEI